jgi:hypothetical protein
MYSPRTSRRCRSPAISIRSRHSRRALPIQRSAIAFARGAYTGVRTVRTPMAVNTALNAAVNLVSRSRIKPLAVYHGNGLIADEPSQ